MLGGAKMALTCRFKNENLDAFAFVLSKLGEERVCDGCQYANGDCLISQKKNSEKEKQPSLGINTVMPKTGVNKYNSVQ
jgi:hypothetical protein